METKKAPVKKLTKAQRIAQKRKNRKPISGREQKLKMNVPDGFVGRWVNDVGGRPADFLAAGWEFVDSASGRPVEHLPSDGTVIRERVDKTNDNQPLYAYMMVIEEELYNQDQAAKVEALKENEKEIARGKAAAFEGNIDGDLVYVKSADLRDKPM